MNDMGMIKDYFKMKRNLKISKKNNEAYDKVKRAINYATSERTLVRLDGSPETFQPLFDILTDEGYSFTFQYLEGELMSPDITYLDIKCKRVFDNQLKEDE